MAMLEAHSWFLRGLYTKLKKKTFSKIQCHLLAHILVQYFHDNDNFRASTANGNLFFTVLFCLQIIHAFMVIIGTTQALT